MTGPELKNLAYISLTLVALLIFWATGFLRYTIDEAKATVGVCTERHYIDCCNHGAKASPYVKKGFRIVDSIGREWVVSRRVPCDEYGNPAPE